MTVIFEENGYFTCACGNIAEHSGFQECDPAGADLDPADPAWDGDYRCVECDLVINYTARTAHPATAYLHQAV